MSYNVSEGDVNMVYILGIVLLVVVVVVVITKRREIVKKESGSIYCGKCGRERKERREILRELWL